jgi:3-methyladenine DNA glycosylase AlkD
MLHPAKTRLVSPLRAAAAARRQLAGMSRPAGTFDASRYFRSAASLGFLNVGTEPVRQMARSLAREHRDGWGLKGTLAFANALIADRYLEVKGVGIEALACYRREFTPDLLPVWKRWLADNHSANWATTDSICGSLIGPLLVAHPRLVRQMLVWSRDSNMWVRRASAVSLLPSVRRGLALDTAYEIARRLHHDPEDLLQKAVGWMLREAGKVDPMRLERYLRANGPAIPRTTVRYAIERFPPAKRRDLLTATRGGSRAGRSEDSRRNHGR